MKKALLMILTMVGVGAIVFVLVTWYPYIFAVKVDGEVYGVERVEIPLALVTSEGAKPSAQVFSYAVAVKDSKSGEIFTASSEDRRWAVVQKGQCAEVKFLPYPPWSLTRSGAYFGARLIRLYDCPARANSNFNSSPATGSTSSPGSSPESKPEPKPETGVSPHSN